MEDFLEAMIPAMPRNDKALQNWRAMHVPLGEPAAQPAGSPILLKTAYKHVQRMLRPHHHVLADAGDSWFNATKLVLPGGARYEVQVRERVRGKFRSGGYTGAAIQVCILLTRYHRNGGPFPEYACCT